VVAPAERARWVGRYRESGLGLKRFAAEHGLRPSQLHYWVYQSRPSGRESVVKAPGAEAMFREYLLPRAPAGDWGAEIALPDGTRLRLERGADPAWVRALLDPLRRPCSH
jgi:transposase-like protein